MRTEENMKKILFVFVLLMSVLMMPTLTFAKTVAPTVVGAMEKPEVKKAEYLLPYPGVLPDHPLYALKVIRDRILDVLIVDPVRKAEFYLLQGDKRLNMSIFLVAQGKPVLAEQVVSKGEKYMMQAVNGLATVKASGKEVPGYLMDRLEKSLAKHVEELDALISKTNDPAKAGLSGTLETVKKIQGELAKLK